MGNSIGTKGLKVNLNKEHFFYFQIRVENQDRIFIEQEGKDLTEEQRDP